MSLDATALDEMRELMARYPDSRSALLPMLHLAQSVEGCVTSEAIETCADLLGISAAEVSGVATFYTMYKRRPIGTHHVGVCTNTLCAVMGGDAIFDKLCSHLGVGNDETSADGAITLERVECNAACDFAPVVMVNWEFFDDQTPESAVELVDQLRRGDEVVCPRGATITSWREAERVMAGFEDGRVDEGPAAGPASLAGLELATGRSFASAPVQSPAAPESAGPANPPAPEEASDMIEPRPFRDPSAPRQAPGPAETTGPAPSAGPVEPRAFRDPSAPAEPAGSGLVEEPAAVEPLPFEEPPAEPVEEPLAVGLHGFVEPRELRDPSAPKGAEAPAAFQAPASFAEPRAFIEPRAFKEPTADD